MLSVNVHLSLQNFSAGIELQLSNIDTPTFISNNKRSLIDHCFLTNEQNSNWKVCLPPFDIGLNVIFFQSKLFLLEEKKTTLLHEIQKTFFGMIILPFVLTCSVFGKWERPGIH